MTIQHIDIIGFFFNYYSSNNQKKMKVVLSFLPPGLEPDKWGRFYKNYNFDSSLTGGYFNPNSLSCDCSNCSGVTILVLISTGVLIS